MKNLPPVDGVSYFYNHFQCIFTKHEGKEYMITVPRGIRILNLRMEGSTYYYNLANDERLYRSQYGWAFIPDTPENRMLFGTVQAIRQKQAQLERIFTQACSLVPTLEARSDKPEDTEPEDTEPGDAES